jgi:hypothetical protein
VLFLSGLGGVEFVDSARLDAVRFLRRPLPLLKQGRIFGIP